MIKNTTEQQMPRISVIIPAYNAETTLDRAAKSVLSNTFSDLELILVNDGSTDRTGEVCRALAACDPRVRMITQENGGVGAARNAGAEAAAGEFIAFVDADDYVDSRYLEELFKHALANDLDWVYCNHYVVKGDSIETVSVFYESIPLETDIRKVTERIFYQAKDGENGLFSNCFGLYKSEIIRKNALRWTSNITWGEDLLFNYEYAHYIRRFGCVAKPLYYYVTNETSSMQSYLKDMEIFRVTALIEQAEELRQRYGDPLWLSVIKNYVTHFVYLLSKSVYPQTKTEREQAYEKINEAIRNSPVTQRVIDSIPLRRLWREPDFFFYTYMLKHRRFETGYRLWARKHRHKDKV